MRHIRAHPQVALHFNTDETGDKDVIVFVGTAMIDTTVPPAHQVRAYLRKYRTGIAELRMTCKLIHAASRLAFLCEV